MKKIIICAVFIILAVSGSFVTWYCLNRNTPQAGNPFDVSVLPPLKKGDLILRTGTVADSALVMRISNSDYSHIGIVTALTPFVMVTEATTDDVKDKQNQVITVPLSDFFADNLAKHGLVLRFKSASDEFLDSIVEGVLSHTGESYIVDTVQSPHLYCTTLIYDEIKKIKPEFDLTFQTLHLPMFNGDYLFPQAFIDSDEFETVFSY